MTAVKGKEVILGALVGADIALEMTEQYPTIANNGTFVNWFS
jgi:hypothetical protein